ncbi:MAG: GT4 family glycosyltransferase PelF, partial [Deltaproteobacteria bacterium]|nr:GT4 family glycosyltransferase PelF [Deltaproteobacteria bacterium]
TDEDKDYYQDCLALVKTLGLKEQLKFTGKVDITKYYAFLDLICLTSISEAQPLVILEANCAGIPVVTSDVGACQEMINGRTPEDKALGPSGLITGVANPPETAQAVLQIAEDSDLRAGMVKAGRERVRRYYQEETLNERYKELYHQRMNQHP